MPRYVSCDARRRASAPRRCPSPGATRCVQVRGERLGQAIGERLDDDRVVVVELALERARQLVGAEAGGHRERADVVGAAAAAPIAARRSRRATGSACRPRSASCCRSMLKRAQLAGVRARRGRRRCRRRRWRRARSRRRRVAVSSLLADDAVEQRLRVVEQLARRRAVLGMVEDRREAALQLPRREEERPVDVRHELRRAARRPARGGR